MPSTPADNRLDRIRHTLSHLLATAVLERFPEAQPAIGPTIEHGFYYDFKVDQPFTVQDLQKFANRIRELIKQKLTMEQVNASSLEQADARLTSNPYKHELFNELKRQGTAVTFFKIGTFTDLCRGGHVENTSEINPDAFKLTHVAGAYWRGDSTKPMLQRIYGVAFATKPELDSHLKLLAEAEARDHRKIGLELDLFRFEPFAPGVPIWLPAGMTIVRELERYWREVHDAAGYQETSTPMLNSAGLYKTSGHWEHFRDNMFTLKIDDQDFVLKPMNCPSSTAIYRHALRSYRDLPLRYSEIGRLHRNEIRGALGGLLRVRQITMDDAHIYCRPNQIEQEIRAVLKLVKTFYKKFNLKPSFKLATMPDHHLGDEAVWRKAEASLERVLKTEKLSFELKARDGAFYGPKIDIHVSDALQRDWQVATIQLDFQMPERFRLEYTDEKGNKQRPVMIHRAIFGSFERFLGVLLEHLAGRLPTWLSPIQVAIIPVGSRHVKPSTKLAQEFKQAGIRVRIDDANETVGYKIRKAERMKVPYMLVIGDKEVKSSKLHIRVRGKKKVALVTIKKFLEQVQREVVQRKLVPKA